MLLVTEAAFWRKQVNDTPAVPARELGRLAKESAAVKETCLDKTASPRGVCKGLSRMRGNSHVRFLGKGAAATPPPYSTEETNVCVPSYAGQMLLTVFQTEKPTGSPQC